MAAKNPTIDVEPALAPFIGEALGATNAGLRYIGAGAGNTMRYELFGPEAAKGRAKIAREAEAFKKAKNGRAAREERANLGANHNDPPAKKGRK